MIKLSILRRKLQVSSKKYFAVSLVAAIFLVLSSSYALNGRSMSVIGKRFMSMWTWMGGATTAYETGAYGTQGSAAATPPMPGSRESACTWTDSSGNKWFFGGYSISGSNYFNDLWKYNPATNEWSWISGSSYPNGNASYGVQGVTSATNVPGARRDCVSWVDSNGIFWMFGGGVGTGTVRNDLWKFDPSSNLWTWMTGSSAYNVIGTYGTQGVAAAANTPGARYNAMTWVDTSGNLWLSGGAISSNYYNDLWKYNIATNQWTWVNGGNTAPQYTVYGTKGSTAFTPPIPGARLGVSTWIDASGNQWMFGGQSSSSNQYYNDLWKYNPSMNQWTWMGGSNQTNAGGVSGTKGTPSASNNPYHRAYATTWVDSGGKFWMFGGMFNGPTYHNSLWKYDPSTNQWTWVSGSVDGTWNPSGVYGTKGVAAAANVPGGRYGSTGWLDGTKLWLFGGSGTLPYADLWMYDTSTDRWTWMSGSSIWDGYGVFGARGSSALTSQLPSSRYGATIWIDSSGNQWIFGGNGTAGVTNELWKYNPTTDVWTWVSGVTTSGDAGVYGTKGVAAASNRPMARLSAAGWVDASNNLWLFGGSGGGGYLNDLWKFDTSTSQWTWIGGVNGINTVGVYGTKGTPSTSNYPGARQAINIQKDSSGNVWFFGGYGYGAGLSGYLNDLWKFNPGTLEWTWISGSSNAGSAGVWGTKGIPSTANYPSGRTEPAGWIDNLDNLWYFGGGVSSGAINDMWKYNPGTGEWTWVAGSNVVGAGPTQGTKGTPAAANTPRAKYAAPHGKDSSGNFWLYGGRDNTGTYYSDLFKFDPSTGQWTWMSGQIAGGATVVYGTKGVPSTANTIGGRGYMRGVIDSSDNFWIFGGYDTTNSYADLWRYKLSSDEWTWVAGSNLPKFVGVYGTVGTSTGVAPYPGSRNLAAGWLDASGNFWMFGGYGNASTVVSRGEMNDLWKYDKTLGEWTWMGGTAEVGKAAVYGTKGVADASNVPGARFGMAFWKDSSGSMWLHGGISGTNYYNDLWKYDLGTNQWTWVSGTNLSNQLGTYGTKGVSSTANTPGGRRGQGMWLDLAGNVWMYGGYGYANTGGSNYLNDLWKYNPSTDEWTWVSGSNLTNVVGVYGTVGSTASVPPMPGGRHSGITWRDSAGKFWLYGGMGSFTANFLGGGFLADLWMYDPATNLWMWASGTAVLGDNAVYGTKGTPSTANTPGSRSGAVAWLDASDNLWLFGGTNGTRWSDLWKYNSSTTEWTWVSGPNTGNAAGAYGTKGTPSTSNIPGARYNLMGWSNNTNTFWLFAGNASSGNFNDLWKFNVGTNEWTWVTGSNVLGEVGTYGAQGSPLPVTPSPVGRSSPASCTTSDGTMWLFGGNSDYGYLNDLWKYNSTTGVWTWMSGSNIAGAAGTYGTKGTAAAANVPGARYASVCWGDNSGNLWLFGGYGGGSYNDLWKYDPSIGQWTWMSGLNGTGGAATYGTKGVAAAANVPGARYKVTPLKDSSGNLWLFGGYNSSYWNDLWKYDIATNQWTWMSGSNTSGAAASYGTQGVANAANIPGARSSSIGVVDSSGNFWFFGGMTGSYNNDLWKYDVTSGLWTWVSGANTVNSVGVTGTLGIASTANMPRSRHDGAGWIDSNDNLWFTGGNCSLGAMNDLWKYSIATNQWTWMSGAAASGAIGGTYGTLGRPAIANTPGGHQSQAYWKDNNGNFWMFTGAGIGTAGAGDMTDMWRYRVK